jgi:chromosome segregation ATPase
MDQASFPTASTSFEASGMQDLPPKTVLVGQLKIVRLKMKNLDARVEEIREKQGSHKFQMPHDVLHHKQKCELISKLRAELSEKASKGLAQLAAIKAMEKKASQSLKDAIKKGKIQITDFNQRVVMLREDQEILIDEKEEIQKEIEGIKRARAELVKEVKKMLIQLEALQKEKKVE